MNEYMSNIEKIIDREKKKMDRKRTRDTFLIPEV